MTQRATGDDADATAEQVALTRWTDPFRSARELSDTQHTNPCNE